MFIVVEGVRQGQRSDVFRQIRINDKAHWHRPLLTGIQQLLGETKTLGLVEVDGSLCRRHAGNRLPHDDRRIVVARVEERFNYRTSQDPEAPTPIGTFKQDDKQEFIL